MWSVVRFISCIERYELCQSVSLLFNPSAYALGKLGSLCISLRADTVCLEKWTFHGPGVNTRNLILISA